MRRAQQNACSSRRTHFFSFFKVFLIAKNVGNGQPNGFDFFDKTVGFVLHVALMLLCSSSLDQRAELILLSSRDRFADHFPMAGVALLATSSARDETPKHWADQSTAVCCCSGAGTEQKADGGDLQRGFPSAGVNVGGSPPVVVHEVGNSVHGEPHLPALRQRLLIQQPGSKI